MAGNLNGLSKSHPAMVKAWAPVKDKNGDLVRSELKRPEQILKARNKKEQLRLKSGPKEARMKAQQQTKKRIVMKTKLKKGGKRRR